MRCYECRKQFKPSRSDQVFHTTECRMKWFSRKAKVAMSVLEGHLARDLKGADAIALEWEADANRRSK